MGCGASAHAKGSSTVIAEAERSPRNQQPANIKTPSIAEDVKSVSDQESKKPPSEAAGGPSPLAPGGEASVEQQKNGYVAKPETTPTDELETSVISDAGELPQLPVENTIAIAISSVSEISGGPSDTTRLVLGAPSSEFERQPIGTPGTALDPAVTPSYQTATVTLLPEAAGFIPRARYTNESDLSIASTSFNFSTHGDDSDDDELAALFTMASWKRFFGYNKKKAHDLLTYFWRKYPVRDFSCYCISYRYQDLLIQQYMADNCVHGFCCRIEELGLADSLFLQMYVLRDMEYEQYRIVGLLLVQGQDLPPALASLSAYDNFVYSKADTSVMLIKQFVSALLVGRSPLNSLRLESSREVV